MGFSVRYFIVILLSSTLLVGQWGCAAQSPATPRLPPSPPDWIRGELRSIGVASTRSMPEVELEAATKGKGSGALKGAAAGFFGSLEAGFQAAASTYDPNAAALGLALGIAIAPVAGLFGTVIGVVRAESADTIEEAEASLTHAVLDLQIQERLRDRVFEVAQEQTRYDVVLLPNPGTVGSAMAPAGERIHTILEIGVPGIGLPGDGINPPVPLVMTAHARLVRAADGAELYTRTWAYESKSRQFAEWADDNAQIFRDEVARATQTLSEAIVDELFLLYPIPEALEGSQ